MGDQPVDRRIGQQPEREDAPPQRDTRPHAERSQQRTGPTRGEDPPAGSVESPVAPGEAQAGDLSELGAGLGGPVDVFPLRGRRRKERPAG